MHAAAADGLDDVEDPLAVVEHVEDRRQLRPRSCAKVPYQTRWLMMRNSSHSMTRITCDAVGHLDAGQLLDRQDVGQVVHHPAEVVHAVGVGDVGVPGLALAHLLGAAVVEADVGHGVDDLLAVELQHDAEDAVGAGVLRARG